MKAIILGDTHFGVRGFDMFYYRKQRDFFVNLLFPYMKEHNIKHIWQTGDLFEVRKQTNNEMVHYIRKDIFDYMALNDIQFTTLAGNHDLFLRNESYIYNPKNVLKDYANITFVTEFRQFDFDGVLVDFVGWMNKENKERIKSSVKMSTAYIALGHFEISGFPMHKGIDNLDGFESHFLSGYDKVYSGHFHTQSEKENIRYVGTPYETSWDDYNDAKGFHVFDTEGDLLDPEFVQNMDFIFKKVGYPVRNITTFDYQQFTDSVVKCIIGERDKKLDYFLDGLSKVKTRELIVIDNSDFVISEEEVDVEVESTLAVLVNTVRHSQLNNKLAIVKLLREIYGESL